jgi:hypothetical protein
MLSPLPVSFRFPLLNLLERAPSFRHFGCKQDSATRLLARRMKETAALAVNLRTARDRLLDALVIRSPRRVDSEHGNKRRLETRKQLEGVRETKYYAELLVGLKV